MSALGEAARPAICRDCGSTDADPVLHVCSACLAHALVKTYETPLRPAYVAENNALVRLLRNQKVKS